MHDVTEILAAIQHGDPHAAQELLPLVYDELRKLAAARLARESGGQTLQPTALVHEAYLRLVGGASPSEWDHRGHFFAAAAEAMRRILIDTARRKARQKHGGQMQRVELEEIPDPAEASDRLLDLNAALERLEVEDPESARLVKLHYFAGVPLEDVGPLMGMSRASAYRQWTYARSWLKSAMAGDRP